MEDERTQSLRKSIREIQADPTIDPAEKGRRIQALMWKSPVPPAEKKPAVLDKSVSYHDQRNNIYGCQHYQRNCKKLAACCGQLFSCRFCHDAAADHCIDRYATREMMCMFCQTVQPIQRDCCNPQCGKQMARYYCDVCKFHDDSPSKEIFHCAECGLCRLREHGEEYFHCQKCCMCLVKTMQGNHKCIEGTMKANCPICNKDMFSSTHPSHILKCGHSIHVVCYHEYLGQGEYTCPVCLKSVIDMAAHWAHVDEVIADHPMPPEFAQMRAVILCNDCERRGEVGFHFYGHKCTECGGYNTKVLATSGAPPASGFGPPPPEGSYAGDDGALPPSSGAEDAVMSEEDDEMSDSGDWVTADEDDDEVFSGASDDDADAMTDPTMQHLSNSRDDADAHAS